jgi:hypothetical protein
MTKDLSTCFGIGSVCESHPDRAWSEFLAAEAKALAFDERTVLPTGRFEFTMNR